MPDPDLIARIEALEQRQLALSDLPLAALQRKLEQDWQPSGSVLLGYDVKAGTDTVTFTAATNSAVKTISHGLGRTPLAVAVTGHEAPGSGGKWYDTSGWDTDSFDVIGWFGSAISGTFTFTWVAVG